MNEGECRPAKITIVNLEIVRRFLNAARRLKENEDADGDGYWRNIYLALDRQSTQLQASCILLEYKKLVAELTQKITTEFQQSIITSGSADAFIGKVLSADRDLS